MANEYIQDIQKAYTILTQLPADIKAAAIATIDQGAKQQIDRILRNGSAMDKQKQVEAEVRQTAPEAKQGSETGAEAGRQTELKSQAAGFQKPRQTGVQRGTVKAWLGKYGFLVPDNGGPDVFVRHSALVPGTRTLRVGETVAFDLQMDKKSGKYLALSCYSANSQGAADVGGSFGPTEDAKAAKQPQFYKPEGGTGANFAEIPSRARKSDKQKQAKQKRADEDLRPSASEAEQEAQVARLAKATSHSFTGIFVVAKGLQEAMHLNGQGGVIKGFDEDEGRYLVNFEGGHGQKLLDPENLDLPWSLA